MAIPPELQNHPVFNGESWGAMSGEAPMHPHQTEPSHENLVKTLKQMGLKFEETDGRYEKPERSVLIYKPSRDQMAQLGKVFGQDSVVFSKNKQHELLYTNGVHEGKSRQAMPEPDNTEFYHTPPEDYYTHLPGHGYFRINFDWSKDPQHSSGMAKSEIVQTARPHPHSYEWHDGHTDHHQSLYKSLPGAHPHMDAPPKNDQAAGVGVSSYARFALPYGEVRGQANPSSLTHYDLHGKLPQVENLVKQHGFQTYYAGGKYGKPDLAKKNYNTGHLMVYDPTPASGGDFNDENYTKSWRQIHELSHALVYPELNKIYGEGRRIGKLGIHRTPNEAMRAVHWEWLAAHKQRELSEKIGVHIPDETFHKELATVMHDAVHRAVTGQFTEPSQEGFYPYSHKVPLDTALDMVRDEASRMGIQHPHGLATKKSLAKAERLAKQMAPATNLHDNVQGFMSGLKTIPQGSPMRGKFITSHMSHPPFLAALQAHPQGKQIHSTLSGFLNSPTNAGFKPGATVATAKKELEKGLPKDAKQNAENAKGFLNDPVAMDHALENTALKIPEPGSKFALANTKNHETGARISGIPTQVMITNANDPTYSHGAGQRILDALESNRAKGFGEYGPRIDDWTSVKNSLKNIRMRAAGKAMLPLKTQKSETIIFKNQEGSMSEKTYSPEEVAEALKKHYGERIENFGLKLAELRKRETVAKALIPPHKHNTGIGVSAANEDVAPNKLNPQGKNDPFKGKGATMEKAKPMEETPGEETSGERSPADVLDEAMSKEELCKTCGSKHGLDKCMGKAELVDSKGKRKSNGEHPEAAMPSDKMKKIPAEGSGGKIKRLSEIKKSALAKSSPVPGHWKDKKSDNARKPEDKDCKHGNVESICEVCHPNLESSPDAEARIAKLGKAGATPPMAKPPSGANMATKVPSSKPGSVMKEEIAELDKGVMADIAHKEVASMGGPAPKAPAAKIKSPTPEQHADRASHFADAMAGAYQPPAAGPAPSMKPKLASPKAAGIAAKPSISTAPAARPGIFGRLFGKK